MCRLVELGEGDCSLEIKVVNEYFGVGGPAPSIDVVLNGNLCTSGAGLYGLEYNAMVCHNFWDGGTPLYKM